jgi:ATP-dependent DNA helicase RecG
MTPEQLSAWVASGESEVLEFKRTTGQRREGTRTLAAMLNHRGGHVLFGVEPDGRVVGQQVGDRTIEELSHEIQNIDPPSFPTIDRVDLNNGLSVLVVSVASGANKPYSYHGQAYRRVGNTTLAMSRDEYNRVLLERLHGEHRWENEPAGDWTVANLDAVEIARTLEEAIRRGRIEDPGTREPEEILRGFGLIKDGVLLRAALVLFGRFERLAAELPQCLLRVARFAGTDKTEFRDNRQFRGHAFELLLAAERFLREHVPVAGHVVADRLDRVDEPLYPPVAVREALANAFCHRDYAIGGGSVGVALYDDRLEVTSSGTLHFGLTPEALFGPHESLPWNPLIAAVFYRRGIIEAWGRGTIKMAELTHDAGLPHPEIEDAGGCVTVRFKPSRHATPPLVKKELTHRQQAILTLLDRAVEGLPLRKIHGGLKARATLRQVREDLAILRSLDFIALTGRGRGARWTRA